MYGKTPRGILPVNNNRKKNNNNYKYEMKRVIIAISIRIEGLIQTYNGSVK